MTDTYRKVSVSAFYKALAVRSRTNNHHRAVQLGVFMLLAAQPHVPASISQLTDWLWGDDPEGGPDNPRNNIRTAIMRLRQKRVPIVTRNWNWYSYEPSA